MVRHVFCPFLLFQANLSPSEVSFAAVPKPPLLFYFWNFPGSLFTVCFELIPCPCPLWTSALLLTALLYLWPGPGHSTPEIICWAHFPLLSTCASNFLLLSRLFTLSSTLPQSIWTAPVARWLLEEARRSKSEWAESVCSLRPPFWIAVGWLLSQQQYFLLSHSLPFPPLA